MKFLSFNDKIRAINLIRVERLKRLLFIKYYLKKLLLRSILSNSKVNKKQKAYTSFKLSFFPRYSVITQQNTRCFRTGRTSMPFRFCLLSRMHLKLFCGLGLLPHTHKSVF